MRAPPVRSMIGFYAKLVLSTMVLREPIMQVRLADRLMRELGRNRIDTHHAMKRMPARGDSMNGRRAPADAYGNGRVPSLIGLALV